HAQEIRSLVRPCINIKARRVGQSELGPLDSRLGGLPHLPRGIDWPRWRGDPLGHIATIRLSQTAQHDHEGRLPNRGLRYCWYDIGQRGWGFDPKEAGYFRVDYLAEEDATMALASFPSGKVSEELADQMPDGGAYAPCRMEFSSEISLPNGEWIREYATDLQHLDDSENYSNMIWALPSGSKPRHRLLGHPTPEQGPMELECQLVTNGLYCGDATGYQSRRADELAGGAKDWRLLLQVESDDDGPGWMWGDAGYLY